MKSYYMPKYGSPLDLQLRDLPQPVAKSKQVLVRVKTTTVNDYEWSLITGRPLIYRLFMGWFKPMRPVPGMELAGMVEQTGSDVTQFKVGDTVYGDISEFGFGAFAEYCAVNEKGLRLKPEFLSFEEAVSIPHASMLAYQALKKCGFENLKGARVLMNGAGGGVGAFVVQLCKIHGVASITGVDAEAKFAHMTELGYDHLIDYRSQDFTQTGETYDFIVDCKSTRSPFAYARALKKGGRFVTVGGTPASLIRILFQKGMVRLLTGRRLQILALKPNADLAAIETLFQHGQLRTIIDGPHAFEQLPKAVKRFGEGLHTGKVVVNVSV